MRELMISGKQTFLGKEIPIICGGFGKDEKIILAKTVAGIHEVDVKYINKLIKSNTKHLIVGEDILDIKTGSSEEPVLENGLFTKAEWGNAKNVYILSRRGYTKIVSAMSNDNNKKWEVMEKLIDEYFTMEQTLKNLIPSLVEEVKSLRREVNILSANPNNYKVFKSLTKGLKGSRIPVNEAYKILIALKILKRDKEGNYSLGDYASSTWGKVRKVQGKEYVYWSAIGFEKIIPKIEEEYKKKQIASAEQTKLAV